MDFYVVFCKNRKKFDKYVKVNRIKNKVIIDIKDQLDENQINDKDRYRDFFNILIYTKISQSMKKEKDIYYIPNFYDKSLDISNVLELKKYMNSKSNFNILMFFDEFGNEDPLFRDLLSNLDVFDSSQIIRDY
jgi:hypothetical protein